MPRLLLFVLALGLLPIGTASAVAQGHVPDGAAPDGTVPGGSPSDSTGAALMLWTLADDDNTVALLGSVHFARPDLFPLAAPIEAAYDSAEVVVFELDLGDMEAHTMKLVQAGMFADTTTLASVLPNPLYARTLATAQPLGFPEMALAKMEPWMLSMMMSSLDLMSKGYSSGIDQHFHERAVADEKPVRALETIDMQIDLFDSMPMAQQVDFLRVTLDGQADSAAMMARMTDAWLAGDAQALAALMDEEMEDTPDLRSSLLLDRNAAWVPQIEALLDGSDDALVVVGAGHLVGDDSVVAMLRAKGHEVTQALDAVR
ncbi:MAG: TraB/GumN family protein [Bacteroidota bacterium]